MRKYSILYVHRKKYFPILICFSKKLYNFEFFELYPLFRLEFQNSRKKSEKNNETKLKFFLIIIIVIQKMISQFPLNFCPPNFNRELFLCRNFLNQNFFISALHRNCHWIKNFKNCRYFSIFLSIELSIPSKPTSAFRA